MPSRIAATPMVTISSTKVIPLTQIIRHPPFSACTICWPSDKMEFIAMTGCLSGTNRHFGNFLRDFKGVGGQGWGGGVVRTRGGCSYGHEGEFRFYGRSTAGSPDRPGAKGRALIRTRGGCSYSGAGVG